MPTRATISTERSSRRPETGFFSNVSRSVAIASNSDGFQEFLDRFADRFPQSLNVLVLDNGRFHKAKSLSIPDNVRLVFLPPYSPELNPVERLWQDLKNHMAFHLHQTLSALKQRVQEKLQSYTDEAVASLTGYEYLLDAARE
nr:transposase [Salinibacter ruber]